MKSLKLEKDKDMDPTTEGGNHQGGNHEVMASDVKTTMADRVKGDATNQGAKTVENQIENVKTELKDAGRLENKNTGRLENKTGLKDIGGLENKTELKDIGRLENKTELKNIGRLENNTELKKLESDKTEIKNVNKLDLDKKINVENNSEIKINDENYKVNINDKRINEKNIDDLYKIDLNHNGKIKFIDEKEDNNKLNISDESMKNLEYVTIKSYDSGDGGG